MPSSFSGRHGRFAAQTLPAHVGWFTFHSERSHHPGAPVHPHSNRAPSTTDVEDPTEGEAVIVDNPLVQLVERSVHWRENSEFLDESSKHERSIRSGTVDAGNVARAPSSAPDSSTVEIPLDPNALPIAEDDPCGHVHYSHRANWLRAMVLGANDGLVSVGALVTGIGAASTDQRTLLLSAIAAVVSGAMSMAAGEFVSVSQQSDTEKADVEKERQAQLAGPDVREHELNELVQIYRERGLDAGLARQVAIQLTEYDVVRTHARDELGIDIDDHPNPWTAAIASAIAFGFGAAVPTLALLLPTVDSRFFGMLGAVSLGLAFLGALGAHLGGASIVKGTTRVLLGGWLAMALTFLVGKLFGADPA